MTRLTCKDELCHQIRHASTAIHAELRKMERAASTCTPNNGNEVIIKDLTVLSEIIAVRWHPMLEEVFAWFYSSYPGQIIITSGWRQGPGIHGTDPLRAFDLRSSMFTNPRLVEGRTNQIWDYGKEPHQVCLFHRTATCTLCGENWEIDPIIGLKVGTECPGCGAGRNAIKDNGPHFHVQVRDETRKRNA